MTYHRHCLHLEAFIATMLFIFNVFLPNFSSDLFFVKGRAALTSELQAFLVPYSGAMVATAGLLCSAKIARERMQMIGIGAICLSATLAWGSTHSANMPNTWASAIVQLLVGVYFLVSASSLPVSVPEAASTHRKLLHFRAAVASVCAVLFIFGKGLVAKLFFTRGEAALTAELSDIMGTLGGVFILAAAAACSARITKTTMQGIGFGYLVPTACVAYMCMQPGFTPLAWGFVVLDGATGLYFIATAAQAADAKSTAPEGNTTATTARSGKKAR